MWDAGVSPSCDGKSWGSERRLLQRRGGAWIETVTGREI